VSGATFDLGLFIPPRKTLREIMRQPLRVIRDADSRQVVVVAFEDKGGTLWAAEPWEIGQLLGGN
jgi:hypothetical protein